MFLITDIAAVKAKEALEAEGKAGWGLRIFISGGSCCGPAYGMDMDENPKEGDKVIEKDGLRVFIDADSTEKLNDMQVDYVDDGQTQGFVIKGTGEEPEAGDSGDNGGGCGGCGGSC
jgi:iron-sulfur cluster assembly accessory protein